VSLGPVAKFSEDVYTFVPNCAYYEFILQEPTNGQKVGQVYPLWEIRPECMYEVVVTTYSGLARCRTGHVVRCTGFYANTEMPLVEYLYDINKNLSVEKEDTSPKQLLSLLADWEDDLAVPIAEFALSRTSHISPPYYIFYIELQGEIQRSLLRGKGKKANPASRMDEIFRKSDANYSNARTMDRLGELQIKILKPGTFAEVRKLVEMYGGETRVGKVSKVITNKTLISTLDCKTAATYAAEEMPQKHSKANVFLSLFGCKCLNL